MLYKHWHLKIALNRTELTDYHSLLTTLSRRTILYLFLHLSLSFTNWICLIWFRGSRAPAPERAPWLDMSCHECAATEEDSLFFFKLPISALICSCQFHCCLSTEAYQLFAIYNIFHYHYHHHHRSYLLSSVICFYCVPYLTLHYTHRLLACLLWFGWFFVSVSTFPFPSSSSSSSSSFLTLSQFTAAIDRDSVSEWVPIVLHCMAIVVPQFRQRRRRRRRSCPRSHFVWR